MKHTILFLAANPTDAGRQALDLEARTIQHELEQAGDRDFFKFETRWAVQPQDLLRELVKLKPTVVHYCGHNSRDGLCLQAPNGSTKPVSTEALKEVFSAAGESVKVVVLNSCYTQRHAEALVAHVDCVVGMSSAINEVAARTFARGFYGGLGESESVAAAFRQGRAAISVEGLPHGDRPQIEVRAGIDPERFVLSEIAPYTRRARASAMRLGPGESKPSSAARADIGILTIREDEFRAVLAMFPVKAGVGTHKGKHREYALRHAEIANGERYSIAVLRHVEQGTGEAQSAARDLLDDLAPRLVLVVGIAAALPSHDITLGDVVLSTRIHDFTVEARKAGQETTYDTTGGPIDRALAGHIANLAAREEELGDWTSGLSSRPPVSWTARGQLYGPPEWQRQLREKLEHHHGPRATPRAPVYKAGPIASSDRLVKDPALLFPWITTARGILAVEMESGGVFRAARENCPMLAIRGISDIVGLQRDDGWAKFASAAAAAFTRAFLRTRPVPLSSSLGAADAS